MTKELVSLESHNKAREQALHYGSQPRRRPNGIACPQCGSELVDTGPDITLTSDPPQKNVGCDKCGFIGCRVA